MASAPHRPSLRDEQRALTRRRLLDGAEAVFARGGFHGASVEEIAREAGATTGALYSNFAGKEDLFLALFEERIAADVGDYSQIVAAGTTIEEQARGAADRWMAILRERPDYFPLLIEFWAYAIREPALRERLAGRFAALRSASARLALEGAERQGYSPGAEAGELVGLLINALGNGLALEKLADPDAVPDSLFGDMLVLIFHGTGRARTREPERPMTGDPGLRRATAEDVPPLEGRAGGGVLRGPGLRLVAARRQQATSAAASLLWDRAAPPGVAARARVDDKRPRRRRAELAARRVACATARHPAGGQRLRGPPRRGPRGWEPRWSGATAHVREPHYYVRDIGVHPDMQGRGLGSALLRPTLERCDREGLPAYLEASSERNAALYERLGFQLTRELRVGGSPPLRLMLRPPHPRGSERMSVLSLSSPLHPPQQSYVGRSHPAAPIT